MGRVRDPDLFRLLSDEKEDSVVKSILLLAVLWISGCAVTPAPVIPEYHPAHPTAPQASWDQQVTTLSPGIEREIAVEKERVEKKHGAHHHHGH